MYKRTLYCLISAVVVLATALVSTPATVTVAASPVPTEVSAAHPNPPHHKKPHKKCNKKSHKKCGKKGPKKGPKKGTGKPAPYSVTARATGSLDVTSKTAVNNAYLTRYVPATTVLNISSSNQFTCTPGSTTALYRDAFTQAVNFVRALSGLRPITLANTLNTKAQAAALMMSANQDLNHNPPRNWRCWTKVGHDAAGQSNLALGYLSAGSVVTAYTTDIGANNTAAGHRRWLLYPFSTSFGVGASGTANATYVGGPQHPHNPNPSYVAWPAAGWFPNPLEPSGRWSLSAGNPTTVFTGARVRATRNGVPVPGISTERVRDGYGQPTLVWQMPQIDLNGTYTVTVSGILNRRSGKTLQHTYTVRLFTPDLLAGLIDPLLAPQPPASPTPAPAPSGGGTGSCFLFIFCS
jgi:uncharacterized protein YkwD